MNSKKQVTVGERVINATAIGNVPANSEGYIKSISDTQITVDFSNGNECGIAWSRIEYNRIGGGIIIDLWCGELN